MDIKNLIDAAIWLLVFFISLPSFPALTALIGATLITGAVIWGWENKWRLQR